MLLGCDATLHPTEAVLFSQAQGDSVGCPYPTLWWQGRQELESLSSSWEIMPDTVQCEHREVILSKRRPLGVFSNFTPTPFVLDGKRYASVEGFWQMMKFPENSSDKRVELDPDFNWKYTRAQLAKMSAFEAKKAGDHASQHMKQHNYNWVTYQGESMEYRTLEKGQHYKVIRSAMQAKLDQNPDLKPLLTQTKGLKLLPDHNQSRPTQAAWQYHQIWMNIRDQHFNGSR